jgi:hypothetical protein
MLEIIDSIISGDNFLGLGKVCSKQSMRGLIDCLRDY